MELQPQPGIPLGRRLAVFESGGQSAVCLGSTPLYVYDAHDRAAMEATGWNHVSNVGRGNTLSPSSMDIYPPFKPRCPLPILDIFSSMKDKPGPGLSYGKCFYSNPPPLALRSDVAPFPLLAN